MGLQFDCVLLFAIGPQACQEPERAKEGMGGSYFCLNEASRKVAIFKPCDEEPLAPNNPKGYVGRNLGDPGWKPTVRVGEVREQTLSGPEVFLAATISRAAGSALDIFCNFQSLRFHDAKVCVTRPVHHAPTLRQSRCYHHIDNNLVLMRGAASHQSPTGPCNPLDVQIPPITCSVRQAALREVAAYLLDHGHFARVPHTALVRASHPTFNYAQQQHLLEPPVAGTVAGDEACGGDRVPPAGALPPKLGSLQEFVSHISDTSELGSGRLAKRDVHRIGILDVSPGPLGSWTGSGLVVTFKVAWNQAQAICWL